jgi:hypothetical protein
MNNANNFMTKKMSAFLLSASLLAAGCNNFQHQATQASADRFMEIFREQLDQFGPVEEMGLELKRLTNKAPSNYSYLLPGDRFPVSRLFEVEAAAIKKWGELHSYDMSSEGADDAHFHISYGTKHTRVFIDGAAYPERGKTRVDVFVRVVE